ncbi:MAG: DUF4148 domain-containing protein [Rhodoferax sp.]|nr:DUF4148 domain-containing protein [Rhodoferax sp.]
MKNATTIIALAIATLAAGSAFAGDAADVKLDIIGMSARQAFPANYGVEVAPGKTRAEVKAELIASQRNRDAADTKLDIIGVSARQLSPAHYGVAVASGKTRAEVKAELAAYRSDRDSADEVVVETGMTLREMFPRNFAKATRTNTGANFAGL